MCNSEPRYFYRCVDCLTISAGNVDIRESWGKQYAPAGICGCCGGHVENMGRVEGERLKHDTERCPCDERCTHAKGPKCSCSCGGVNHGTGMVVAVKLDAGPVPVIESTANYHKAQATATEFRELLRVLKDERDRINRIRDNAPNGWLDRSDFDRHREVCRIIHKACELRTHAGRMKLLRSAVNAMSLAIA